MKKIVCLLFLFFLIILSSCNDTTETTLGNTTENSGITDAGTYDDCHTWKPVK